MGKLGKENRPYLFSIIGLAAVVIHFVVILTSIAFDFNDELDLIPVENLVVKRIEHEAWDYMHPIFTQDWFLFAPRPVFYSEIIEVKGYYTDADGRQSALQETAWLSINDVIRDGLRGNRLRALNFLRNSHSQVIDPLQWQYEYVDNSMQLDRKAAATAEEAEVFRPIERYASYFLQKQYPGVYFETMDVRIKVVFALDVETNEPVYPEETIYVRNLAFVPPGDR